MIPLYIFGSGQNEVLSFYHSFLKQEAEIIAIDGGANLLKELDVLPNWVIGDFDSISQGTMDWLDQNFVKKYQYPKEKDFSDFDLACQKICSDYEPTQVEIFSMLGKRSDHFLFNLIMGEFLLDHAFHSIFYSSMETVYFMDSNHPINGNGELGDTISIFPLKKSVLIHQTIGLKYSLWEEKLSRNSTRGLSNELMDRSYQVSVSDGQAMIIHNRIKQ